jgi:hypothetical protein
MKVTYSTSKINSFGGINFADSIIGNTQVLDTIDQMLGSRGVRAQYRYSDLFSVVSVDDPLRRRMCRGHHRTPAPGVMSD